MSDDKLRDLIEPMLLEKWGALSVRRRALGGELSEVSDAMRKLAHTAGLWSIRLPGADALDPKKNDSVSRRIAAELERRGRVTVAELRPLFPGVHPKTIGVALNRLHKRGKAIKTDPNGREWFWAREQ